MDKRLQRVDNLMKKVFGEKVELLSSYGPVQMCCFGLTYSYLPTNERIIFECERGIITVRFVDLAGNMHFPSQYFKESAYYHWEDHDNELQDLVYTIKCLIELMKQK